MRGNNATCLALGQLSVTFPATHKLGLSGTDSGGWVCVHSRTLWVSPMKPPVRLGVLSADETTTCFYSQSFRGFLFWCLNPVLRGQSSSPVVPPGLSPHKCGTASCCLTTQSSNCYLATCPLCPGFPSPPLLPISMNVSSLIPSL